MLNKNSVEVVDASTFSHSFRKPLYDSYCFSNIPGTIETLLTGDSDLPALPGDTLSGMKAGTYDTVVLFFVDAFGWRFFERYQNRYPTLQKFLHNGCVSKITSQFPSTTAAHVTTIHTGKRVDESGVFEWFYYEPLVDDTIAPLMFGYAGKDRGGLIETGINPDKFFPNNTLYERFAAKGITSHLFQSSAFTPSLYGNVVTKGVTEVHAFGEVESALQDLARVVKDATGKTYIYFYYGTIDAIGHEYGTNSAEFQAGVDEFFTQLELFFISKVTGRCGNALLLMTADHGQTDVDPRTTIYINQLIPELETWTKVNRKDELIIIGGSCRDLFLYIKDEYLSVAIQRIQTEIQGKAEVYATTELLEQGFFGDKPSETLRARLGNVCILPYEHDSVYWWQAGRFEQNLYGHHGGLTPAEMESVFAVMEL